MLDAGLRHRDCWFPRGGFERLEPYERKLSSPVLRGACGLVTVLWAGNGPRLPGGLSAAELGRYASQTDRKRFG
jgi:hypothetical protein